MSCDRQATLWLFDQVGREAVPERVHPDALFDARELNRLVHHAVQLPGRHGVERIAAGEITGDVVFMALLRSRCEADRLTPKHTKQSLRTQLPTDPKSKHPYRASGLVLSPIVSLRERLLSYPKVTDRSTSYAEPGPGDPAGAVRPVRALRGAFNWSAQHFTFKGEVRCYATTTEETSFHGSRERGGVGSMAEG